MWVDVGVELCGCAAICGGAVLPARVRLRCWTALIAACAVHRCVPGAPVAQGASSVPQSRTQVVAFTFGSV